MSKTIIVWYRDDLRVHDHPALSTAADEADHVVPVFIFDKELDNSDTRSSNRNRFLLECLDDLKQSLTKRGANLVIRHGDVATELKKLVSDIGADAVYYSTDYTPFGLKRDKHVKSALGNEVDFRSFSGLLAVGALDKLHTKSGTTHKVFTPFYKNWLDVTHRKIASTPSSLLIPSNVQVGSLPKLTDITTESELSPEVLKGGETNARKRLHAFINDDLEDYKENSNDMAANRTSRLSPYLHFGCLSIREIEDSLPDTVGARSWRRQLCWREFYTYIIYNFPDNEKTAFQEKYRKMMWGRSKKALEAWQTGKTGYPAVDAGMRQLNQEGWMHNRARLIVGSFLTKDLWLDWRLGEAYFYKMLLDGDVPNNNGNWQWIASVGVDPAPVYRRLYNPARQLKSYDPDGRYTRKYVPELKDVPDKYLAEPWKMPEDVQKKAGCIIGKDYPEPIVDHAEARAAALDHYRAAA